MSVMITVGVREFRDGLSKYLSQVKEGESLTVTEHGRPIARITPTGDSVVDRLIAEGRITPARQPKKVATQSGITAMVSDLIDEQRR